ncbi:MAG: type II secretion system protein [Chloroflexi bacterium]|nr:type II secretion system protein [Chloroflexota bacterium]
MQFFKYGQKGFTLIELLVVIAILGTLAGVVVLNVIQFIGKGACEAASTEKHNIQTAAVAYTYNDSAHQIPPNVAALAPYLLTTPKGTWTLTSGVVSAGTYPGCASIP